MAEAAAENTGTTAAIDNVQAVLGIDVGGTSIKMGVVTPRGEVLAQGSI